MVWGKPGAASPFPTAIETTAPRQSLDLPGAAAVIYLGSPLLIFILGWIRPTAAVFLIGLVTVGISSVRTEVRGLRIAHQGITRHTSLLLAAAVIWAYFGGGSHFVYANPDWIVRDAVIADLTASGWPVSYGVKEGHDLILRSAIGFFLLPATIGKMFGPGALPFALFLWTSAGVAIFFLLLPQPANLPKMLGALVVIVMFSGMDVLGYLLLHGHYPVFPLRLEWWSDFQYRTIFSYSSLSGQLIWAPNHALPMWIGTTFLIRYWNAPWLPAAGMILIPSLLLATPFALPGLLPFLMLWIFDRHRKSGNVRFPPWTLILFAAVTSLVIARMLTLDIGAISVSPAQTRVDGGASIPPWGFLKNYAAFVLLEFLLLALVLLKLAHDDRALLIVATLVLLSLPFLALGPSNDLLLRVSTPSIVVLAIVTIRVLFFGSGPDRLKFWRQAAAVMLILGSHTAINELWRAGSWDRWSPDYTKTLIDTQNGGIPPHYIGRLSDPLLALVFRQPQQVAVGPERFGPQAQPIVPW